MITGNEIKTRGIKAIAAQLKVQPEVAISKWGKVKYVVMTLEQYEQLRLAELEMAHQHVMEDVKTGNFTTSLEEHFTEIDKVTGDA